MRPEWQPHRASVAGATLQVVAMIRHWAFFKHSGTAFGVFYPTHYIVAGYPSLRAAQAAELAFTESGVEAEDVRATAGDFVVNQLEAHRRASHWLQQAGTRGAGFASIETKCLDDDNELARQGGAFLFMFAPDDRHVDHARKLFGQHRPSYARRYLPGSIERIVEPHRNACG